MVTVHMTTHDDDVVDRAVPEYGIPAGVNEDKVEMLARCLGIEDMRLDQMDGWADLPPTAVSYSREIELDNWEEVSLGQ